MKLKPKTDKPITDHTAILLHLLSLKDINIIEYTPQQGTHIITITRTLTETMMQCPHEVTLE